MRTKGSFQSVVALSFALSLVPSFTGIGCNCGRRGGGGLVSSDGDGTAQNVNFGNVPLGQTSHQSMKLTNQGSGALRVLSAALSGANASDFKVQGTFPLSVVSGGSSSLALSFSPGAAGPRQATIVLDTDSSETPTVTATLEGVGVDVAICAQPAALAFGNVQVQGTPSTQQLQLQNCGQSPADVAVEPITGAQAGDFTATGPTTATLQPGQALSLTVAYAPQAIGPSSAQLPFTACSGCQAQTVDLSGAGVDGQLTFNPTPVVFGNTPQGQTNTQNVQATNTGTDPLVLTHLVTQTSAFVVQAPALPATLAPQQSLSLSVVYTATGGSDADQLTGTFSVADAAVAPRSVNDPLQGDQVAGPCALTVTPTALSFGNVTLNSPLTEAVSLNNTGTAGCQISSITLGSNSDPGYSLPSSQATTLTIGPGSSAPVSVSFVTTNASPPFLRQGSLVLATSDTTQPTITVPLTAFYNQKCANTNPYIYTIDENSTLSEFDPVALTFHDIGTLNCGGAQIFGISLSIPNSMAVDQSAVAWVGTADGNLFQVSTSTASCAATSFTPNQNGLSTFGMGFVSDPASGNDTLYIAGGSNANSPPSQIATIAFPSLTETVLSQVNEPEPELTGTGDGELWGFFPGATPPTVSQITPQTGALSQSYSLPSLAGQPNDWAMSFYGGAFWVFLERSTDSSTTVYKVQRGTGALTTALPNTGRSIVGAGVSTCAPLQ